MGLGPMGPGPVMLPFEWARWAIRIRVREQQDREREQQDRERERLDRERERVDREREQKERERDRESSLYEQGNNALYENRWDSAVKYFSTSGRFEGHARRLGALLEVLRAEPARAARRRALHAHELTKNYPSSRYIKEAKVLEVEVRGASGQPMGPDAQADEEMQIIAMNALANSDPAQAVPLLERSSPARRRRAERPGPLRAGADQQPARP